ncbi:hypothetical protein NL108_003123 [Boleophthalmus pectinirostris]|uniref:small integral membrane protein 29-like n=1 Tax=Boleophthalmus pectinirostris TaxID=150288 RepID=UPI000A1C1D48|nr:small integral membrane protein 29-like [Boleophthalmus pectinirostris]KAJ0069188.1 hypothetical protein NL108_003123 [Boleophthalmus pectinirostris]
MEDYLNHTTPYVSPSPHNNDHAYFLLIPIVLVMLVVVAMGLYYKSRYLADELRHRLIPMYTYDPAEQDEDDLQYGSEDETEKEPLHRYGRLTLNSESGN